MKKAVLSCCLLLALGASTLTAQNNKHLPKYLDGAVTLQEGKVVFSEQITSEHLQGKDLFALVKNWAQQRFTEQNGLVSRIVLENVEDGDLVVAAEEYIVFSSSALALDRTRIYYNLHLHVDGKLVTATMNRIRYWYNEARDGGERYAAEDWITDKWALNKSKTKLVPITGKFRRETIDLKDELFASLRKEIRPAALAQYTPAVSAPVASVPVQTQPVTSAAESVPAAKIVPAIATQHSVPANTQQAIAQGRCTITANDEVMELKASNWGGTGSMMNKEVLYLLVDKARIGLHSIMQQSKQYTIRFYAANSTTPTHTVQGQQILAQDISGEEALALKLEAEKGHQYTLYTIEMKP